MTPSDKEPPEYRAYLRFKRLAICAAKEVKDVELRDIAKRLILRHMWDRYCNERGWTYN